MYKFDKPLEYNSDNDEVALMLGKELELNQLSTEELQPYLEKFRAIKEIAGRHGSTFGVYIGEEEGRHFFQGTDTGLYFTTNNIVRSNMGSGELTIKTGDMIMFEHEYFVIVDKELTVEEIGQIVLDTGIQWVDSYLTGFFDGKDNANEFTYDYLNERLTKLAKQKKENEEARKKELEEREKIVNIDEEKWEKTGTFADKDGKMVVTDNSITIDNKETYTFSKKIKEMFSFSQVSSRIGFDFSIVGCTNRLLEYGSNNADLSVRYIGDKQAIAIHIENNKSTINGTVVSKAKLLTILRNIGTPTTDKPLTAEKIKALNNLGVVKQNLIKLEEVEVKIGNNYVKVPISFLPDDEKGDIFKVNVIGSEAKMDWEALKKMFSVSVSNARRHISATDYFELMNSLGVDRAVSIEKITEAKMLQNV